jgi:Ca2+-binding EF-hand superfamily protein/thiol-disulfide isomerase/thioredoxin
MAKFVDLFGPELVGKEGPVSTSAALEGKIVGVYFSAHWCPPCRQFTPQLADAYSSTLKSKGFEVVFVSMDRSEDDFKAYHGSMPWLARPFSSTVEDIYGSVFIQGGTVGMASYHFDAKDDCYLSYSNAPAHWALDDGTPMPERKPFEECSFDKSTRTFRGKVTWPGTTSFLGGVKCGEYRMVFDPEFARIIDGEIKLTGVDGDDRGTVLFGTELEYSRLMAKHALESKFKVQGIPTLVVLNSDGTVITKDGRAQVIQNLEGFPWLPDTELRDKCDQIFDIYDEDKDGFLNCKEIGKLALETGGGALPESEFVQVAALLACDPKKGITKDALFKGYTEMGMGDIAKDLALASDPKTRKKAQILAVAKEGTRLNAEQLSMIFDQYDPEKELTKAEFRALWGNLGFQEEFMQTYFTTLDTDENGLISFKELLAGLTVCSGADVDETAKFLMKVFDTHGNGVLEKDEFDAAMRASIKVLKAAVLSALEPMMMVMGGPAAMSAAVGADGEAKDVMQEIMKSFELPEPEDLQEAFDQIDANQDGKLTLEELTEAMKKDSGLAKVLLPSNLDLEGDPFGGACSVM